MVAEANESVVRTARLTKIFKDFWLREKVTAVVDLDLDIHPKEVFGLLGPNGSGKSTTLKIILGLLFPTRGRVSVFGHPPTNVRVKSRIGFLPEESYLYPFLNARETLDFYGQLFRLPGSERERRIDMLLDMVGLSSVAYRRVGEYSKGMQRRIGLAQALINDPDLLILDEPTAGMDPIGTAQFKELIRTLAQRGKTVILSSHLLADVEDVCDRVCILYGGKRRALGDIDDLLARGDQMQITTDSLDAETLAKVADLIAKSGKTVRDVSSPRDKLETLFLRIVEEARLQRVTTGGATAGGKVADFLKGSGEKETGQRVIEELVAAATEPVEPQQPDQAETPTEPDKVDEDVLGDLISASGRATEETREPAPSTRRRGRAEVDKGVIEELIDGARDETREPEEH